MKLQPFVATVDRDSPRKEKMVVKDFWLYYVFHCVIVFIFFFHIGTNMLTLIKYTLQSKE